MWVWFMEPQNNYNSHAKDHCSHITITNVRIMNKPEILQRLPGSDTQTWSECLLLESGADRLAQSHIATNLQFIPSPPKKAVSTKCNKTRLVKWGYLCTKTRDQNKVWVLQSWRLSKNKRQNIISYKQPILPFLPRVPSLRVTQGLPKERVS